MQRTHNSGKLYRHIVSTKTCGCTLHNDYAFCFVLAIPFKDIIELVDFTRIISILYLLVNCIGFNKGFYFFAYTCLFIFFFTSLRIIFDICVSRFGKAYFIVARKQVLFTTIERNKFCYYICSNVYSVK